MPNQVNTQASDQPVMIASTMAANTPGTPPPGRYPMAMPVANVSVAAIVAVFMPLAVRSYSRKM